RMDVMKNNLPVAFEFGERVRVTEIVAVHVSDGHFQHLPLLRRASKRRIRAFHTNVHLPAEEAQTLVAHHCAGEQSGFEKNLKSVTDTEDQPARARKTIHRFHHRGKARDSARAQVITESESARKNDDVAARQLVGLVPDEFNRLAEDGADGIKGIVVAIRSGKTD